MRQRPDRIVRLPDQYFTSRCSPRLLEFDCRTVAHLKLANALCRSVAIATEQDQ